MPLEPPTGLPQRRRGVGFTQARKASTRTSESLRGFWVAAIVGGRRYLYLPARRSLHCPWEDGGAVLRRIIGLVLVAVAVSATASAQERVKPGETFRDCVDCPKMVVIPAGNFMMGLAESDNAGLADERPRHRVTIPRAFALGKYEVTFAEWDACVRAGGCNHRPKDWGGWGRGNRPVMNVSWDDAKAYVRWLSRQTGQAYRLPSEAEWEYAARAGTTSRYHWGDSVGRGNANCNGCGSRWEKSGTAPVGSFSANRFGLYDMLGNVWEWEDDCWNDSYRGAPTNGRAWTSGQCSSFVLRGGSWLTRTWDLRSANRWIGTAGERYDDIGFRVARTLP